MCVREYRLQLGELYVPDSVSRISATRITNQTEMDESLLTVTDGIRWRYNLRRSHHLESQGVLFVMCEAHLCQ